jgi:hypothetical protein
MRAIWTWNPMNRLTLMINFQAVEKQARYR